MKSCRPILFLTVAIALVMGSCGDILEVDIEVPETTVLLETRADPPIPHLSVCIASPEGTNGIPRYRWIATPIEVEAWAGGPVEILVGQTTDIPGAPSDGEGEDVPASCKYTAQQGLREGRWEIRAEQNVEGSEWSSTCEHDLFFIEDGGTGFFSIDFEVDTDGCEFVSFDE